MEKWGNLPEAITPTQAAELTEKDWKEAVALVNQINTNLRGIAVGERKTVVIPIYLPKLVYKKVREHFSPYWHIEKKGRMEGDPGDPREQTWDQWEFSAKIVRGQLDE